MQRLLINSQSSGEFKIEKRGGRDFIVTQMLPIQSESVMNGLLYPATSVLESYNQLDKLPAPAGHPSFDGKSVSASDPEGGSSFNVGAFVRNPVMNGHNVLADLVVDVEVANRTNQGKDIIDRIMNGKRMGVSTGLNAKVTESQGKSGDKEYQGIVNGIKFDHVAILLSEAPAGDYTYTLNSGEYFKNHKKEDTVMRQVVINTEDLSLEQHKLLDSASSNPQAVIDALNHKVTAVEAESIVTNSGKLVFDGTKRQLDEFLQNKDAFESFKVKLGEDRKEKVEFVLANSKMKAEQLTNMATDALDSLVDSIVPANKHIVNGKVEDPTLTALEEG